MSISLNIYNPKTFKAHRSGWGFVIQQLLQYQNSSGILFDDFLDITFGYNRIKSLDNGIIPYKKPWIGVLHHPPKICPWYADNYKSSIDIHNFLNESEFLISLEKCEGLIVLSEYLKDYLYKNFIQFKNIPIVVVKHPTEPGQFEWSFDKFKKASSLYGMKILSIGYFLRNMTSIYRIKSNRKLDKYLMPSDIRYGLNNLSLEMKYKNLSIPRDSIKILNWQEHSFYDKLLEQSLVFLDLYDTSCNNAIIESIIRQTPLLINKHPAICEYLGNDYPLYYKNIDQACDLINYDSIYEAHTYLKSNNTYYSYLNPKYFIDDFTLKINKMLDTLKSKQKITHLSYIKNKTQIITQPTKFKHRHGWPYVTSHLYDYCEQHNKKINKNHTKLYISNFLEHTFKNDGQTTNKTLIIDNKKHTITRGYNLFSGNNTDIVEIENKLYEWKLDSWQRIKSTNTIKQICDVNKILNYKRYPWIGIAHNPVHMPLWFDYSQNIHSLLQNDDFIDGIKNCKCLITLSLDLKNDLEELLKKKNISLPIVNCYHPIPETDSKFNFDIFRKNRNILQIGYWLRNMHSFWSLNTSLNKIWLYGDNFASHMIYMENISTKLARNILNEQDIKNIQTNIQNSHNSTVKNVNITKVSNYEYDKLLRSSIVFLNLYASSANNAIIECLASGTPVLVNKLDSVVEYLGPKYPMYYNSLREAEAILSNESIIKETSDYLGDRYETIKHKMSIETFISLIDKQIEKYAKNN